MKRIFASLLLCSSQALMPSSAAAPADAPTGAVQAARKAVDGDKLGDFFTQFERIPFNNPDRATVLNHLFAKPQFALGDVAKSALVTILHQMYKDRFKNGVDALAAQLEIPQNWREYLQAANPKLGEFFDWVDGEKKKEKSKIIPGECEEKPATQLIKAIRTIAEANRNQHPCQTATQVYKILEKEPKPSDLLIDGALLLAGYHPSDRFYILGLLQKYTEKSFYPFNVDKAAVRVHHALRFGCMGEYSTTQKYLTQIAEDYRVQLANTEQALLHNISLPKELIDLIKFYAVPYRLGRSIWNDDSWSWVPGGKEGGDEMRVLDSAFSMVDDISYIPYVQHADRIKSIQIYGHVMEKLPTDIWQYLPHVQVLMLKEGLLTDYPAEIEQLPKLKIFNLDGNPLNENARERYEAFRKKLGWY